MHNHSCLWTYMNMNLYEFTWSPEIGPQDSHKDSHKPCKVIRKGLQESHKDLQELHNEYKDSLHKHDYFL